MLRPESRGERSCDDGELIALLGGAATAWPLAGSTVGPESFWTPVSSLHMLNENAQQNRSSNPITGIACCARAASGHTAAAPPSSVMNSRRLLIR